MLSDLKVDGAITATQLERHYQLSTLGAPALSFIRTLSASKYDDRYQHAVIFTLSKGVTRLATSSVLHLLGTTEMRQVLGASSQDWTSSAHRAGATQIPDALWASAAGEVAIEYDTGTYSFDTIRKKITVFSRYPGGIVWGTPSPRRAKRIAQLYPHVQTLCLGSLEDLCPRGCPEKEALRLQLRGD